MCKKKVFVSGCFDLLHSGHIAFLENANRLGEVYVCIGSDNTIKELKGRYPVITQDERKYILESISFVKECKINEGNGSIDFYKELLEIKPNIFIVNEDGDTIEKFNLCKRFGIKYKVLKRNPSDGLPQRATSKLRNYNTIPYRIDLAGGWLDQPFINKKYPGSVLTISIEPSIIFNKRSGMASSTRNKAIELWNSQLPLSNFIKSAKILFSYENPPGTEEVSGSQDALGIMLPGLNKLYYKNGYWPNKIESVYDEKILNFLEKHLFLLPLKPRKYDFDVLKVNNISKQEVINLSKAADEVWNSIINKNLIDFGKALLKSFNSQINLFPNMLNNDVKKIINEYKEKCLGYKLSGSGGGGYLIMVSLKPIIGTIQIKIRRKNQL